jgi:hypothetical protein
MDAMRSKTSATLLLVLTFAMGGIAGAASFYLYQNHVAVRTTRAGSPPSSQGITGVMGNYLDLDSQQKEELKTIVSRSRDRYKVLSQQFRPQYEMIRNETRQQIRHILRPDQQAKFEEFLKDMDRRHKAQQNSRY